jgi:hypothetical protein
MLPIDISLCSHYIVVYVESRHIILYTCPMFLKICTDMLRKI